MTTRESGVCSCNGEWNVYLQGRVECVATKESGLYTYKGEWNVRPLERVEWQQRRVECVAARESGACSCKGAGSLTMLTDFITVLILMGIYHALRRSLYLVFSD